MKKYEIEMSNKFYEYVLEKMQEINKIPASKFISELLKNEDIKKPTNLTIKNCSISDLKYKGKNVKRFKFASI